MKQDFKLNGYPYCKYMLCYVDDLIHIGFKPKKDMDALNMIYCLKEGFGTPEQYLGEIFEKVQLEDGKVVWSTNSVGFLKGKIEIFDNLLGLDKTVLNNYGDGHMSYSSIFRPELDVTEELGEEPTDRYHKVIGVMRWSI